MTNQTQHSFSAAGKTGSHIAGRLAALGQPVSRLARRFAPFDWNDRATWRPALDGVRAAYITYQPDWRCPAPAMRSRPSSARPWMAASADSCSCRDAASLRPTRRAGPDASGADWTAIRASWFNQNFSEGFLLDMVLAGELVLRCDWGAVHRCRRHRRHRGRRAHRDRHIGELYEVTGPRLLSFADAADAIGRAAGRGIAVTTVSRSAFQRGLVDEQVPADYAWLFDYLFHTVLDGRNARSRTACSVRLAASPVTSSPT